MSTFEDKIFDKKVCGDTKDFLVEDCQKNFYQVMAVI